MLPLHNGGTGNRKVVFPALLQNLEIKQLTGVKVHFVLGVYLTYPAR